MIEALVFAANLVFLLLLWHRFRATGTAIDDTTPETSAVRRRGTGIALGWPNGYTGRHRAPNEDDHMRHEAAI